MQENYSIHSDGVWLIRYSDGAVVPPSNKEYLTWIHEGNNPVPYITPALTTEHIIEAMAELFDRTAQSKGYDNRITCALRAGYQGPFHAEGQAFATWMDNCNEVAYSMLVEVEARTMEMPGTIESALSMLPSIVWP